MLRRVCAIAVAAAIPALAGCEAGSSAPVLQWHPPVNGTSKTLPAARGPGYLGIRNLFVLGPVPGGTIPAGSSAGAFLALTNTGARDRLIAVTAPGAATTVTLPGGGVTVGKDQNVLLTGPVPEVVLRGLTHSLAGGGYLRMVLRFQNAGSITLTVPVLARSQYYSTYSPAPAPSATATARHKHRKGSTVTVTPSPGVTPAPTGSYTPSPSPSP